MRNQERRRYQRGLLVLMTFGAFVLGLILLHGVHDLLELTSAQKPLLSDGLLRRMNNHERILNSYPHKQVANSSSASGRFLPEEDISLSRQKVVYVIVDGLRYDYLWKNPKLRALVTRPDFQIDSRAWKIYASTPTISVPNWAALVTGVPPEVHGMLANDGRKEMLFDSVMRSARRFGIPRAMAGISWLSEMYRSDLELTRGDGAITYTALHEYELVNPDPMAAEMLLNSFDRTSPDYEPYRLFLMHFMAVDDMGHLHGVTTDYNPYNTYQKAISNTTRVLASLIDLLDNDTTLVITADHGHIDRGGHGGTHPQLYAVPLLMYRRGSGLGQGVEVNYPPAESDTSDLPEPHLPIGGPDDTEGDDLLDTDDDDSIFKRAAASHETVEASAAELQVEPRAATANTLTLGLSAERAQSNLNVVGTVCGLLGIPAPRQSVGLVIEEVIDALVADPHQREAIYRDLFLQKKGLVYELFRALGANTDALTSSFNYTAWATAAVDDCAVAGPSGAPPESTPEARVECYKAKANHLLRAYYVHRDDVLSNRITRNVLINLGFTLFLVVFAVWLVHRCSLADPRAVPVHAWRTATPLAKRLKHFVSATIFRRFTWFSIEALPLSEDCPEVDQSVIASHEAAVDDCRALAASLVVVSAYYPINIVALVTFCAHLGNDWDFSLWNFTQDAYLYLALVPLMSVCVFIVLAYIYSLTTSCRALRRFRAADCTHETAIIAAAVVVSVVPRALVRRWAPAAPASTSEQWPGGWRTSFGSALRCSLSAPYQAALLTERYLFAHYTLLVALAGLVVIKALEGCYGVFLFPGLWRVQLLDATTWTLRFQLLGVELMQAPLFALALAQLALVLVWPRYSSTSGLFDALFTRRSHHLCIRSPSIATQQQRRKEEEESQLGDMGLEPMSSLSSPDMSLSLSSSSSINNIDPLELEDDEEEDEDPRAHKEAADEDDGCEGEEVAPESLDLATLLDRAVKSDVGGVASPVDFFAAQQPLLPRRRGSPDELSREE